jgi:energy-coupling factor transport system permease protein
VVLHPATRILIFLIVAVALQWLHAAELLALTAALAMLLAQLRARELAILLRRARFLLLSLLSIYAFATPGESLLPSLGAFSPTAEGLRSGALQVWKLTLLLASLALLMATTPRQRLLAGLYVLLLPGKVLGVNAERIAVRLWLTLHYAEAAAGVAPWRQDFRRALEPGSDAPSVVTLQTARFTWVDAAALAASLSLAALMLS